MLLCATAAALGAQSSSDSLVFRGLDLESRGAYREAAAAFRAALSAPASNTALIGLERVYAELGQTDSILPVVQALIARRPADPLVRMVQLRALHMLGRVADAAAAFEGWVSTDPGNPAPYRGYVQLLLEQGQTSAADSVLRRASLELRGDQDISSESAQLHAAMGRWVAAARSWRVAIVRAPHFDQAAVFSLQPATLATRDSIRAVLRAQPVELGARRILSSLELAWGRPADAWAALTALPVDDATIAAWVEFAEQAERSELWGAARDAYVAAFERTRMTRHAIRGATAALAANDPGAAIPLATALLSLGDSVTAARNGAPLLVRALSRAGRIAEAEAVSARYAAVLSADERERLAQELAAGWVREGNIARARSVLGSSRSGAAEVEGWIALFEGDLRTARVALRRAERPSADVVLAQSVLARTRADSGRTLGSAFLALTQRDSARAAQLFAQAADAIPDAAPLLLAVSARMGTARPDVALALWQRIANEYTMSPEGSEAHLEWGRALKRRGDVPGARAVLENLILTYPRSALVPQARMELERMRGATPTP